MASPTLLRRSIGSPRANEVELLNYLESISGTKRFEWAVKHRDWNFIDAFIARKERSSLPFEPIARAMSAVIEVNRTNSFQLLMSSEFGPGLRSRFPLITAEVRGQKLQEAAKKNDLAGIVQLVHAVGERILDRDAIQAFIAAADEGHLSSAQGLLNTVLTDSWPLLVKDPGVLAAVLNLEQDLKRSENYNLVRLQILLTRAKENKRIEVINPLDK